MTHFPDHAPYHYETRRPLEHVFHIGWLSRDHPFVEAPTAPEDLLLLCSLENLARVNQMRGYHDCEFCPPSDDPVEWPAIPGATTPKRFLGSAELWFRNEWGTIFASPDLVIHYIHSHGYSPPPEFWGAIRWTARHLEVWHPKSVFSLLNTWAAL